MLKSARPALWNCRSTAEWRGDTSLGWMAGGRGGVSRPSLEVTSCSFRASLFLPQHDKTQSPDLSEVLGCPDSSAVKRSRRIAAPESAGQRIVRWTQEGE